MNRFKKQAFFKEFPFLGSLKGFDTETLSGEELDSLKVSRFDEETLERVPSSYYWDGSLGVTDNWQRVDLVLKDGSVIHDAVQTQGKSGSNYAYTQTQTWEGETILEAIDRHGVADSLAYVVLLAHELNDWEGSRYVHSHKVTVFKPARGVSVNALIDAARSRALREVQAECNF